MSMVCHLKASVGKMALVKASTLRRMNDQRRGLCGAVFDKTPVSILFDVIVDAFSLLWAINTGVQRGSLSASRRARGPSRPLGGRHLAVDSTEGAADSS